MSKKGTTCRHISCLSERRIKDGPLTSKGESWLCLTCLREWENKSGFIQHGRTKNHPLCWVCPEKNLYCSQCSSTVNVESLNAKQKENVEKCIEAVKSLLSGPSTQIVNIKKEETTTSEDSYNEGPINEDCKGISRKPPGLYNLGNTCFMNSALQSFAAIKTFSMQNADGALTSSLFDLLGSMRNSTGDTNFAIKRGGKKSQLSSNAINPSSFFRELSRKYEFFSRNNQEDSHDFIRLLFNAMDDEHCSKTKISLHRNVFGGTIVAKVECQRCKATTCTKELSMDVSLSLNSTFNLHESLENLSIAREDDSELNLFNLFQIWNRPYKLDGEDAFACSTCYQKYINKQEDEYKIDDSKKVIYSPAICRYSFTELSHCLIIHLQRFSLSSVRKRKNSYFGYGKDNRSVKIPLFIDLKPFASDNPITLAEYRLVAYIIHEGSTANFGHYISVVRRDDKWYRISDSSVTLISEDSASSCRNAYILFYEKLESKE